MSHDVHTDDVAAARGARGAVVQDPADDVLLRDMRRAGAQDSATRERWATLLAARLDVPMSVLGVLFLLVVLGQDLAAGPPLSTVLSVAGWMLWVVFVAEFCLRLYVAPDRARFLRRNWWQVLFLALPFLRFLRLVRVLRLARAGRVLSSAVRSSRSAGRVVRTRLAWLAAVSVIVVLSSSQLLYVFGVYDRYGQALHDAALATITGEPLDRPSILADVLEVGLAVYSVAVLAGVAGAIGAYFVDGRR
jgi:voltage-gated potassium channel